MNDKAIKEWFDSLLFFGKKTFVLDEIENLISLVSQINKTYIKIDNYQYEENFSSITKDEMLNIVQTFLNKYSINIDVYKLLENNILKIEDSDQIAYYNGLTYMDSSNQYKITINFTGSIFDCGVLVHEIMHYINRSDIYEKILTEKNFTNMLLTESISYAMEIIFYEDLENSIYQNDQKIYKLGYGKTIECYCNNMVDIYKIILIYKKTNGIKLENYQQIYKDNNYDSTILKFQFYLLNKGFILKDTSYIIGLSLAIYMFVNYQKDNSFINNIIEFNNAINNNNFKDSLKVIGINDLRIVKETLDDFLMELDSIYLKKLIK